MGDRLQVHPTSVTSIVDRLEAAGLVAVARTRPTAAPSWPRSPRRAAPSSRRPRRDLVAAEFGVGALRRRRARPDLGPADAGAARRRGLRRGVVGGATDPASAPNPHDATSMPVVRRRLDPSQTNGAPSQCRTPARVEPQVACARRTRAAYGHVERSIVVARRAQRAPSSRIDRPTRGTETEAPTVRLCPQPRTPTIPASSNSSRRGNDPWRFAQPSAGVSRNHPWRLARTAQPRTNNHWWNLSLLELVGRPTNLGETPDDRAAPGASAGSSATTRHAVREADFTTLSGHGGRAGLRARRRVGLPGLRRGSAGRGSSRSPAGSTPPATAAAPGRSGSSPASATPSRPTSATR